jgi:hypothetical protein
MNLMQAGDCFYNKAVRGVPSHPWTIISDPEQDPDNVLIVNLTDADTHHDTSCVLTPSEVPWLAKPSCIAYQFAKLTSVVMLEKANTEGLLFGHQTLSIEVLALIREGAAASEELRKTEYLELLRKQGLA